MVFAVRCAAVTLRSVEQSGRLRMTKTNDC
jgi:hypothetical protein